MELLPVESSHIESIGYDGDTSTLGVCYKSGKIYVYGGVTATQFGALMTASSKGRWLAVFTQTMAATRLILKGGAQKTGPEQRAGKFRAGPLKAKRAPDCSFGVAPRR
jgi:hypothetical protein